MAAGRIGKKTYSDLSASGLTAEGAPRLTKVPSGYPYQIYLRVFHLKRQILLSPLIKRKTWIGSSPTCGLRFPGNQIWPKHALIIQEADKVYLKSFGAPVFLKGKLVSETRLMSGERLTIGEYQIELVFSAANPESSAGASRDTPSEIGFTAHDQSHPGESEVPRSADNHGDQPLSAVTAVTFAPTVASQNQYIGVGFEGTLCVEYQPDLIQTSTSSASLRTLPDLDDRAQPGWWYPPENLATTPIAPTSLPIVVPVNPATSPELESGSWQQELPRDLLARFLQAVESLEKRLVALESHWADKGREDNPAVQGPKPTKSSSSGIEDDDQVTDDRQYDGQDNGSSGGTRPRGLISSVESQILESPSEARAGIRQIRLPSPLGKLVDQPPAQDLQPTEGSWAFASEKAEQNSGNRRASSAHQPDSIEEAVDRKQSAADVPVSDSALRAKTELLPSARISNEAPEAESAQSTEGHDTESATQTGSWTQCVVQSEGGNRSPDLKSHQRTAKTLFHSISKTALFNSSRTPEAETLIKAESRSQDFSEANQPDLSGEAGSQLSHKNAEPFSETKGNCVCPGKGEIPSDGKIALGASFAGSLGDAAFEASGSNTASGSREEPNSKAMPAKQESVADVLRRMGMSLNYLDAEPQERQGNLGRPESLSASRDLPGQSLGKRMCGDLRNEFSPMRSVGESEFEAGASLKPPTFGNAAASTHSDPNDWGHPMQMSAERTAACDGQSGDEITEYMNRLLERLRQESSNAPVTQQRARFDVSKANSPVNEAAIPKTASPVNEAAIPKTAKMADVAMEPAPPVSPVKKAEAASPAKSQPDSAQSERLGADRLSVDPAELPDRQLDLASIRHLSNVSARHALSQYARRRLRESAQGKLVVSGVAALCAAALVWMAHRPGAHPLIAYSAVMILLVSGLWLFQFFALAGRLAWHTFADRFKPSVWFECSATASKPKKDS